MALGWASLQLSAVTNYGGCRRQTKSPLSSQQSSPRSDPHPEASNYSFAATARYYIFAPSAILGRIFSAFGSYQSVHDASENMFEKLFFLKNGAGAVANESLSHTLAVLYSSGTAGLNAGSEASKVLNKAQPLFSKPLAVSQFVAYRSWTLAALNGITTGASAYNGVRTLFSPCIDNKIALDCLGAYFGVCVALSSSIFNAKESMDLDLQKSRRPALKGRYFWQHFAKACIPLITNAAFSAYQVLSLLHSAFDLENTNPVALAAAMGMMISSDLNLKYTQITRDQLDFISTQEKAAGEVFPLLPPGEASESTPSATGFHRLFNLFAHAIMHCSWILNPLNTPEGLEKLFITLCGMLYAAKNQSDDVRCDWIDSEQAAYAFLIVGMILALPSSDLTRKLRVLKAKDQFDRMTASVTSWFHSSKDQSLEPSEDRDKLVQDDCSEEEESKSNWGVQL